MTKVLICDIDNTLYDFVGFFAPSFRAMIHALSRELNVPEDDLIEEYRKIYQDAGSLEYRFSTQRLPFLLSLSDGDERRRLEQLAEVVFSRIRRKYFKPYPSVKNALESMKQGGVHLVVCTNAPSYLGIRRLYQLGLLKYFERVLTWSGFSQEGEAEINKERELLSWFEARGGAVHLFNDDQVKPSPAMFAAVRAIYGPSAEYFAVGDSIKKDLIPAAREIGATTVWAEYGSLVDPGDVATLDRIVPWSDAQKSLHYDNRSSIEPSFTIKRFDQILDVLGIPRQLELI